MVKHHPRRHVELPRVLTARGSYRNAYNSEGDSRPLVDLSKVAHRSQNSQRRVIKLHRAFDEFFMKAAAMGLHKTVYDLHRYNVYAAQDIRLCTKYRARFDVCRSILDLGCGTGKLPRRIARINEIMGNIEAGRKLNALGIDFSTCALAAAVARTETLFQHHPKLAPNLRIEYLLMDLKDLSCLDLSKTCIGECKTDLVIASDVFRWLPETERVRLLDAVRKRMTPDGRLISMEFSAPPLPVNPHLPKRLAMEFAEFAFAEPFLLNKFYEQARDVGLEMVPNSLVMDNDPVNDLFPPLVSCVFRLPVRAGG